MANQNPPQIMKYRKLYFALSLLAIAVSVVALLLFGLKPSIDFTGGTLLEIQFPETETPDQTAIEQAIPEHIDLISTQETSDNSIVMRLSTITAEENEAIKQKLGASILTDSEEASNSATPAATLVERRFETVGPTLGQELLYKTYIAILLAASSILLYIAYRFKQLKYGVCAVIAMAHDSIILIGAFALLGHFFEVEVDTLFVTAVLTTLSFSVHDTIVVYDRIRELVRKHTRAPYEAIVNKAVAETLVRSINNSMTIIFMLLALWLMGGESTRWFVFALLVGTITGTYSSTFIAAPLLLVWERLKKNQSNRVKK